MKRVLILYHSGVTNTRMVAEKVFHRIYNTFDTKMYSVEQMPCDIELNEYDSIVIGFPTIHATPSKRILEFINGFSKLTKPLPAFIFTTCGLCSANTLRIFAKHCIAKNIIPVLNSSYRCSATDGALIAPWMDILFRHEKGLDEKIDKDCACYIKLIQSNHIQLSVPRFKLYSIINYPNKFLGQHLPIKIYLHKNKCIKCEKCIHNCPSAALTKDNDDYPKYIAQNCEKCLRCIHKCPQLALSLSKKKTPRRVLS